MIEMPLTESKVKKLKTKRTYKKLSEGRYDRCDDSLQYNGVHVLRRLDLSNLEEYCATRDN